MKKNITSSIVLAVFLMILGTSCSSEDRCFTCTLNATTVDVCESNVETIAASNGLEVESLEEFIDLITPTGFVCTEIE